MVEVVRGFDLSKLILSTVANDELQKHESGMDPFKLFDELVHTRQWADHDIEERLLQLSEERVPYM